MQNGRMENMNRRPKRPAGPPGGRSRRWSSNAPRPAPNGAHNAQKNYERYLALAQAEVQAGDRVAAENYYQARRTLFQVDVLESDIGFHIRTRAKEAEFQSRLLARRPSNGDNAHCSDE